MSQRNYNNRHEPLRIFTCGKCQYANASRQKEIQLEFHLALLLGVVVVGIGGLAILAFQGKPASPRYPYLYSRRPPPTRAIRRLIFIGLATLLLYLLATDTTVELDVTLSHALSVIDRVLH